MFKPLHHDGKFMGFSLRRAGRLYFFGSRHATRDMLARLFPQYEFCYQKQVHGKSVVRAAPNVVCETDAQFTDQAGLALVAQSADCMPILLSGSREVCAVHAGWRGLAQNIVAATKGHVAMVSFAAIGPHIQQPSFEVGLDVALALEAAAPPQAVSLRQTINGEKCLFDLHALGRAQLKATFGANLEIAACLEDTKTNLEFHSFRRDREKAERQYSFVVIED